MKSNRRKLAKKDVFIKHCLMSESTVITFNEGVFFISVIDFFKSRMQKSEKKRNRESNHRWTEKETWCLLEAIAQKVQGNPEGFEKPTAQKFYEAVCSKNDPVLRSIVALGHNTIKNKMRYLKKTFVAAEEWKGQTGAGLLEEGNEKSVKEYVEKICPHYGALEQIFGLRKSVVLPHTFDSYADISFDSYEDISYDCEPESQECLEECTENNIDCTELVIESTEEVQKNATECLKKKMKLTPKEKKSNSALDFLIKSQEKRNEVEERKIASHEKMEERKLAIQQHIEQNKLDFQRELLEFEKEKHRNEFEIQKIKLDKEMELKKLELELKYKAK